MQIGLRYSCTNTNNIDIENTVNTNSTDTNSILLSGAVIYSRAYA